MTDFHDVFAVVHHPDDFPLVLTDKGFAQARDLWPRIKQALEDQNIVVDTGWNIRILCTPVVKGRQTADMMAKIMHADNLNVKWDEHEFLSAYTAEKITSFVDSLTKETLQCNRLVVLVTHDDQCQAIQKTLGERNRKPYKKAGFSIAARRALSDFKFYGPFDPPDASDQT